MSDELTLRVQSTNTRDARTIMPRRGPTDTVSSRTLGGSAGSSNDSKGEINEYNWQSYANCRGVPVDVFFPERGDPGHAVRKAKEYCNGCKVKKSCLELAVSNLPDNWGVFGGTTAKTRIHIRRALRRDPNYLSSQEAQERYGLNGAY